jgi:HMW1-like protein
MNSPPLPSLEDFERAVTNRDAQASIIHALTILQKIDEHYGGLQGVSWQAPPVVTEEQRLEIFATRFAASFAQLICDPALELSPPQYENLMLFHRWIVLIFASGGFQSTGYLLPLIGQKPGEKSYQFGGDKLLKMFTVFSPSGFRFNLEECFRASPPATAVAFLNYLGTRYCFTEPEFEFRERILEWLPGKLEQVTLGDITLQRLVEPFMHCSYAVTPRKHAIKADMIAQLRRACLRVGSPEWKGEAPAVKNGKPVLVVVTEHFGEGHSVHRTHSGAVRSLKESFHVIGLMYEHQVSPPVREIFDEVMLYPQGGVFEVVRSTAEQVVNARPAVVFHLGVGMSPHTIALASLRLGRVQCTSFGHTATTMSPVIDYMILPEDFVVTDKCYSETVSRVPANAMPYVPRRDAEQVVMRARDRLRPDPNGDGKVRVAIPASVMKLNSRLFDALHRIKLASRKDTEFHFYPLAAVGLSSACLKRKVHERLPDAVVHTEYPYPIYMERLGQCDLFLCPFPYGNMNSIVDTIRLGIPGICLDGEEAHAHADAAYFARMGLPSELIAKDVDAYVAAAVRLIDDLEWRKQCRQMALAADLDAAFFRGDASLFCREMERIAAGVVRAPVKAVAGARA